MAIFASLSVCVSNSRTAWWRIGVFGLLTAAACLGWFIFWKGMDSRGLPTVHRQHLEDREGQWFQTGDLRAFTGWMVDTYPDGAVRLRSSLVDGRLHGISEGWSTNGVRELRESFKLGLADGVRTTWYPNGHQRSEGTLVAGLQQGEFRQWHDTGGLAARIKFKNGQPHGLSQAWYPSGCLQAEALMTQGHVAVRHFYQDGEQRVSALLAEASNP